MYGGGMMEVKERGERRGRKEVLDSFLRSKHEHGMAHAGF
jgi:hypothetical protein